MNIKKIMCKKELYGKKVSSRSIGMINRPQGTNVFFFKYVCYRNFHKTKLIDSIYRTGSQNTFKNIDIRINGSEQKANTAPYKQLELCLHLVKRNQISLTRWLIVKETKRFSWYVSIKKKKKKREV